MKLTAEQEAIVRTDPEAGKPIKVTAFAGTGKTSTLKEYAGSRIELPMTYIAYNKAIQEHAERTMPKNVRSKTIHSLAYAKYGKEYKEKLGNLKIGQVMKFLGTKDYKVGLFVTGTLEKFFSSAFDYIDERSVPPGANKVFGEGSDSKIVEAAEKTWRACMHLGNPDVVMPHDGYLKLYQLSNPQLRTGLVLMDESQDTTPCVWDIIMRQRSPKIVVGDPHQTIYQFRGSVNAMDMIVPEPERDLPLTKSFRFGPALAEEATRLLSVFSGEKRKITGNESLCTKIVQHSGAAPMLEGALTLCRGNSMIFEEAYNASQLGKVGFIGGSSGYRLDLYLDGLKLKRGEKSSIGNALLRIFNNFDDFEDFAMATEDVELQAVVHATRKYGSDLERRVATIRAAEVDPRFAKYVFSTIHKAKGLEWPRVILGEDIVRVIQNHQADPKVYPYGPEEANLLYVALTRASSEVYMSSEIHNFILKGRTPVSKKKSESLHEELDIDSPDA